MGLMISSHVVVGATLHITSIKRKSCATNNYIRPSIIKSTSERERQRERQREREISRPHERVSMCVPEQEEDISLPRLGYH